MALTRPIRRAASGRQGAITQPFLGEYHNLVTGRGERPGYVRTDLSVDRGKRSRFTGGRYKAHIHLAIDYSAAMGSRLLAAHGGKIIRQGTDSTGGKFIYLRVKQNMTHQLVVMYYHLSGFEKRQGDLVKAGDTIGWSGNSGGTSTGAHLHFELMRAPRWWTISMMYSSAMRYDPQPFINGRALTEIL
jgi:murein DD-endopeptidase MepM/ murein hydrolase activator NlpD